MRIQKRLIEVLVWIFGTALLFTIYFLIRNKYEEKYLERKEEEFERKEKELERRVDKTEKKKKK